MSILKKKMANKFIETYYKNPIRYDYLLSIVVVLICYFLDKYNYIKIPDIKFSNNFASDIGAIGLTFSGFILTLITILISFKSSQITDSQPLDNNSNAFKIFLASGLYNSSIKILQRGVVSLIVISFLIFLTKLIVINQTYNYLFYFNIVGLIIVLSTFFRCYYVLGLILKMQK
jgi:hypothetical protein